jgi:uncharacterized protein
VDVGELIRTCRRDAGLSQRELARQAGTSQPALARYERGRATPSLATLERIVAATGRQLRVSAEAEPQGAARALASRRKDVLAILARHGVEKARVFGSVARGEDTPDSDLDLLVDMPSATLVRLGSLRAELEEALGVAVDVTTRELLAPAARERAAAEARPL